MLDVRAAEVARGWGVVEEGREFGWDLGENVFWGVDGEVGKVLL